MKFYKEIFHCILVFLVSLEFSNEIIESVTPVLVDLFRSFVYNKVKYMDCKM